MHGWQANKKRTCAQPVKFRVIPENEIPRVSTRGYLLVEVTGLEPTTSWSLTKRATKLRYTSVCSVAKQHNLLYMIFRKSKTILPAFREFFNFWMTLRPWPPSEQFWPFRHERGSKRKRPAGAGPLPAACSNCPNIERQRRLPPRPPQK